jgi:hypothetical protein
VINLSQAEAHQVEVLTGQLVENSPKEHRLRSSENGDGVAGSYYRRKAIFDTQTNKNLTIL